MSQSILKEAGQAIQDECSKQRQLKPNFGHGDMIVTPGFKLKAKTVYHGSVKAWDGGKVQAEKASAVALFVWNVVCVCQLFLCGP